MMRDSNKRFPDKEERRQWVYGELDRMYPPLEEKGADIPASRQNETLSHSNHPNAFPDSVAIQGLAEASPKYPDLTSNATMSHEIGLVQANRLRVVEERPGKATLVHLDKALSPAPSWAALGWLETSIRSYAKFVDVASKATANDDGEASVMRLERMAIDEMNALMDEMRDDGSG